MRTPEEIQAEIDHLKAEGVHHMTKEMRSLRAELKAAEKGEGPDEDLDGGVESVEFSVDCSAPDGADGAAFASDEWRFVERCCAELSIDVKAGTTTGLVKFAYNQIDAKVKAWRLLREIVQEVGVGGKWPQWSALNRNAATGEKEAPKPKKPKPEPKADAVPTETEAGMPIRSGPSKDDIMAAVMGGSGPLG